MKCAKCLWKWLDMPVARQRKTPLSEGVAEAATVYGGNALCLGHVIEQQMKNREEGADPWR